MIVFLWSPCKKFQNLYQFVMTYLLSNFECVNIEQVLKGVNKQPIAIGSFSVDAG